MQESSLYRHIHESESSLYDSTAWDWSDVNGKKIVDIETDDKLDENVGDADSNDQHNSVSFKPPQGSLRHQELCKTLLLLKEYLR